MQRSGFTRREIVCRDLNIQYRGYYKQTWIYVDTTKRGILCKYNHLDVFYYYRIIYVHVKMLDIYMVIGLFLFASVSVADPVPWPWGRERGPGAGLTLGQLGPRSPS